MGRIIQTKTKTYRRKKVPKGYHKCPNCGGAGVCKDRKTNISKLIFKW